MKNWNKPEIEEINVTLTMGGKQDDKWEASASAGTIYVYVATSR